MKYLLVTLAVILGFSAQNGIASEDGSPLKHLNWPFNGVAGTFDRQAAQRGYQVYREVCSACHSMRLVSYRNLMDIGFSDDEVKAIAAEASIQDGPNNDGEMFERPGRPSDHFAAPYPNEKAARAANGGAFPPDLSLIVKARAHGPDYVYSLLTGYSDLPEKMVLAEGMHYNPYFPGGQVAMPAPLSEGLVSYKDGTAATVDQMSRDVVTFLQWVAEPEMEQRKRMGLKVMAYLAVFTLLFYWSMRRLQRRIK